MTNIDDAAPESPPANAHRRRDALRSLAGIGAASVALLGRNNAAGASPNAVLNGSAGPEGLHDEAAQISASKRGPRGKRGKRGPVGPPGPGVTITRNDAETIIPPNSNGNAQANCVAGLATGGGVGLLNTSCSVITSGPVGLNAWAATGRCPAGETSGMTVTVICLS